MFGQAADLDIWRHPITLIVIAAILSGVGTAVAFALRSIMSGQRAQNATLGEIQTRLAVIEGVDANEAKHGEERMGRIEADVKGLRSEVGAVHRRIDSTLGRLEGGHPEVRP